jgi:ABC-type bacteriocin/lantibiotic exporter with double-glycine peptidase domain
MSSNIFNCGPAALATILKSIGIYTTEAEMAKIAGTDETGTSLYGLKTAAQAKGATEIGVRLTTSQLQTNNIVVLSINGVNHFEVVQNMEKSLIFPVENQSLRKMRSIFRGIKNRRFFNDFQTSPIPRFIYSILSGKY